MSFAPGSPRWWYWTPTIQGQLAKCDLIADPAMMQQWIKTFKTTYPHISSKMVGLLSNTVDPGPYVLQVCQDTITYNTCISACGKAAWKESLWLCPKILDHTLLTDFVFGFVNWLLFLFSVVCCNFGDSPFCFYMEESARLWIDMFANPDLSEDGVMAFSWVETWSSTKIASHLPVIRNLVVLCCQKEVMMNAQISSL